MGSNVRWVIAIEKRDATMPLDPATATAALSLSLPFHLPCSMFHLPDAARAAANACDSDSERRPSHCAMLFAVLCAPRTRPSSPAQSTATATASTKYCATHAYGQGPAAHTRRPTPGGRPSTVDSELLQLSLPRRPFAIQLLLLMHYALMRDA